MIKKILTIVWVASSFNLFSQGCSDAGFCSLGNVQPLIENFHPKSTPNKLRIGVSYGKGLRSLNVYNSFLEYSRKVSKTFTFNTRLNFTAHAGNDIQTGEIGDIFFTGDFKIAPRFTTTTGFKIPFKLGNKVKKGVVLPMDYQNTLGTFDFLWALQTNIEKFKLALGCQIPLTQNENRFFSNNFIASEDFPTTNGFRRNADVWFRLSYPLMYEKFTITPNLLPIYHLGNDSYLDAFGMRKPLTGSKGLTLNADIQLDYKVCENSTLGLNFALPLITRDLQPEGMGRKYVIALDYRKSF